MTRDTAAVVIVGGGAVGTSIAYHLTELGITDVLLFERDAIGSGSTAKSAGGFRTQFADELNIRIALRSLAELESFPDRFGADIGFERAGYLFLIDDNADRERFRAALALQHSLGVPSRELTPEGVAEMLPQLETADLVAGTFCPLDGYATPEAVVAAYADAARSRGVRIVQGEAVERIRVLGGRILGVATRKTEVTTNTVVCAAGAWSRHVGRLVGVDLPVEAEPRRMHYTPESGGLPRPLPLTIDYRSGFYFHGEGPGLVFGGRQRSLEELAPIAARRLPLIADLPVQSTWEGFYEMSPDRNGIVGEAPEPSRFLYATGFSGHGFQQSPAVGEYIAERVAGIVPRLDLSALSVERFARGEARHETFVI